GIIGPTKASMIACIEPVVATICSVVFLGNPFSFLDAIGFAFILSTVFIVAYISDRENKKNTTQ
ncbi:MAG: EamA family transporter, partial [Flavobacteriaceae bacterium]|nr:EamA family transporter [Flavobacteriaceae bacterium]